MDSSSSDDGEPKVLTVFSTGSNNPSSSSKSSTFDTIAYTIPKKDSVSPTLYTPPPMDPYIPTPTAAMSKTNSMVSMLADDLQSGDTSTLPNETPSSSYDYPQFPAASRGDTASIQSTSTPHIAIFVDDDPEDPQPPTAKGSVSSEEVTQMLQSVELKNNQLHLESQTVDLPSGMYQVPSRTEPEVAPATAYTVPVPPASIQHPASPAFYPNPVEFPTVGMALEANKIMPQEETFLWKDYSTEDSTYQAWIPSARTNKILQAISADVAAGTHVPDKEDMSMPGIILADDLVDKVGVNVRRIFGSPEASRRKTFTADNATQDDNGLRELIKLGCYRAAINLTKRLLTLQGQGPGKIGHFSKHTPHSLQLWFLRISLLVRIREFSTAEAEVEAFKGFDKPDMYYEYYSDGKGPRVKGSLVPFHFRVLAAEIPQYMRKFNDTINKLYDILHTVRQILENLGKGLAEDGSDSPVDTAKSLGVWRKREVRVLYSLANSSLFAKDYHNAFKFLCQLCDKDGDHLPQLKSAIGRLFLQHGDVVTAESYFQAAADLRSDSEVDQVDSLVDSALLAISQNQFLEAVEFLRQALMLQPENFMITNNLAVCHLYLGNVKESLALMETTVQQNMPQSLQENVILNLCSVYELENSDGSKKLGLLKLISEYKGDGINLASLKLPDLI